MSDIRGQLEKIVRSLTPEHHELLATLVRPVSEPIAITGIGCRFPGAGNPAEFWELLCGGVDAVSEPPPGRWNASDYDSFGNIRFGGFLRSVADFDAEYFSITPREAARMDPQQRLMLEVAVEALEDAGLAIDSLAGSATGVFIGVSSDDYGLLQLGDVAGIDAHTATGVIRSVVANRLSFALDLKGPSIAIDTACSSSLVAVHLAARSLRSRECNLAIAGGSSLILSAEFGVAVSKLQALAADGRCKTFDARADGFVRGEGCGVIVLKRLSDAIAAGDPIHALIRGTAVNQDGHSQGLTAPSGRSQQELIRTALRDAEVEPDQVTCIEAHGTGTPLGDPIEVNALSDVYGRHAGAEQCFLGSVKTNIGHLEAAAGIAGLIKLVLSLENKTIPPHLHFRELNPEIRLEGTRFSIPCEARPFRTAAAPRFAAVSSFGIGGTNSHVILAEAPPQSVGVPEHERPAHLLTISAKSPEALAGLARKYAKCAAAVADDEVPNLCFTANTGRSHFSRRLAVTAGSGADLCARLTALSERCELAAPVDPAVAPRIAFLFTGQGSQYHGMGRELYQTQPVFRAALNRCDAVASPLLGESLLTAMFSAEGRLHDTAVTQPALFALEFALAELWRSFGVKPFAVMGHSVGEFTAACVAGVFSPEEGLRLVVERGRLMDALPRDGSMAAVFASEREVADAISAFKDSVSIAAHNAHSEFVISGDRDAVEECVGVLTRRGIRTRPLSVSHAFHSPLMLPVLDAFERAAAEVSYASPRIKLISNVTGGIADAALAPAYWRRHVLAPVRFHEGLKHLAAQGAGIFIEAGPNPVLIGLGRRSFEHEVGTWLPSLQQEKNDWDTLLGSVGKLYELGVNLDLAAIDAGYTRRRISAPTYAFEHHKLWLDTPAAQRSSRPTAARILGERLRSPLFDAAVFQTRLNSDTPLLSDHRIYGSIVVPGAYYLAMAIAAGAHLFGNRGMVLRDVVFERPLVPDGDTTRMLQLIVTGNPTASLPLTFRVVSATEESGEWITHATGMLGLEDIVGATRVAEPPGRDVDAVEFFYAPEAELGLELGPAFRWMRTIRPGADEAWCQMAAPEVTISLSDAQPALVDSCLQALVAGMAGPSRNAAVFVPIAIERMRWRRWLEHSGTCHAKLREAAGEGESRVGDALLCDEFGDALMEIEGVHLRAAARESLLGVDASLYEVMWRRAGEEHTGDSLPSILVDLSVRQASSPDNWQTLAVSHCMKVLEAARSSERLLIVTAGAQSVAGPADVKRVDQAAVWGLCRVLSAEFPELECRLLDVDPASSEGEISSQIERVRRMANAESQLAYRSGQLYVARLVSTRRRREASIPEIRAGARYLITGGTGSLGLHVARWLAGRGARHLTLCCRSAPSAAALEAVAALRRAGVTVDVIQADVSKTGEIARLVAMNEAPVRGVVHAAGVLDDGMLTRQDEARLAAVLAPKVAGAANLHVETLGQPLDFFILFSSAASVLGPEGQGAYAAANAFLDALAHHRRAANLPALAVSWGPWDADGMASGTALARGGYVARSLHKMSPSHGIDLLERAIETGAPHLAAMDIGWERHAESFAAGRVPALWADLVRQARSSQPKVTPAELPLRRIWEQAPQASRSAAITAYVAKLTAKVMGFLKPESLGAGARLFDAGMDSLMALELYRHLQSALGQEHSLPSTIVFDYPTVGGLANHICAILERDTPLMKEVPVVAEALDQFDGMSSTQLEAILDERLSMIEAQEQPTSR